jgi:hypothetical protein
MIPSSFAKGRGMMYRQGAKLFCSIGFFPFCLIFLLLSGCATLNKEECLNADWYSIGYVDGARGYPASKIGEHRQACAEYSVRPDFGRYDEGRIAGLVEYCNPRNGYWLGTKGALYSGVCPKNLEGPFFVAYQQGKIVYETERQVKTGEKEVRGLYRELENVEREMADDEHELVKDSTGRRRRIRLLDKIKVSSEQQKLLQSEIAAKEYSLEALRQRLTRIKTQSPYR